MGEKPPVPIAEVIPLGKARQERRVKPSERPGLQGSAEEVLKIIELHEEEADKVEEIALDILDAEKEETEKE